MCSRYVQDAAMILSDLTLTPGQMLARGTARHLLTHDYASVEEFTPARGLRVDIMAVGPKGQIWVIECKSSRADFQSDQKWQGYLPYCDRFFWAVDSEFPMELLPEDTGLIIADSYGAETVRMGPEALVAAPRRKKLMQHFGRTCALRLQALRDPMATTLR